MSLKLANINISLPTEKESKCVATFKGTFRDFKCRVVIEGVSQTQMENALPMVDGLELELKLDRFNSSFEDFNKQKESVLKSLNPADHSYYSRRIKYYGTLKRSNLKYTMQNTAQNPGEKKLEERLITNDPREQTQPEDLKKRRKASKDKDLKKDPDAKRSSKKRHIDDLEDEFGEPVEE